MRRKDFVVPSYQTGPLTGPLEFVDSFLRPLQSPRTRVERPERTSSDRWTGEITLPVVHGLTD